MEEVRSLPGGRFELPGTAQLDDLEERLDVTFDLKEDERGEVTTIAGYLMTKLGRVPEKGDHLKLDSEDKSKCEPMNRISRLRRATATSSIRQVQRSLMIRLALTRPY